jgi:hypothetical protein
MKKDILQTAAFGPKTQDGNIARMGTRIMLLT